MDETTNTWTPAEVNNTIEHTAKCVATVAVVVLVTKNVSQFFQFTGRDFAFNLLQRKLYKSF